MADLKTNLTLNDKNFSARLDSACKKAQNSLGQLGKTTKGLSGVLGSLGGQVGGAAGSLASLAGSFSSLLNPVTASVAAIGLAAKAFFDYNKELEKCQRLASEFTGLDGNQLSSFTNKVRAIASSTGKDFEEVLHATEEYARTMGITFDEAANRIQDGFVAGADESGNFLQNLRQYDTVLKDVGLTAEETIAVMSQTRSGLFDENGLAAIQMASKNIGNMSAKTKQDLAGIGVDADAAIQKIQSGEMTTFQFLQQIAAKMKEQGRNTQEYGAVLQDVFGKKGTALGEGFVNTLAEMSTDIEEVKAQTGEHGQVMDELINTTTEWNNACETLFGSAGLGLEDMGKKIKIQVLGSLTKVINKMVDLWNECDTFRSIIAGLVSFWVNQWNAIKTIIKSWGVAIKGLADAFKRLMELDFSGVGDSINGVIDEVKKNFTDLGKSYADTYNKINNKRIIKVKAEPDKNTNTNTTNTKGGNNDKGGGSGGKKTGKGGKNKPDKPDKQEKQGPAENSIDWLQNKISELNKAWKSGTYEGTIEQWKADVEKYTKILNEKLAEIGEGQVEIDPESYEGIGQQLSDLKQKYAQNLLDISPEEYERQIKELEQKQHNEGIKKKIIIDDEDLERQIDDILKDPAITTFEMYVKPQIDKSFEGQLSQIEQKMSNNDQKLLDLDKEKKDLDDYKAKWGSLTDVQQQQYDRITAAQTRLKQENENLGQSAVQLNETMQKQGQMANGFNAAADAASSLGSAISAAGAEEVGAMVGIASTIAQTIGSLIAMTMAENAKSVFSLPFPASLAAAATAFGALATIIGQIKAAMGGSFAQGGIVGGGKYYGDKNIVNVDSGEMILNRGQQGRLWNMINSNTTFGSSEHGKDNVQFVLRGSDLYGSISNYKKITKK